MFACLSCLCGQRATGSSGVLTNMIAGGRITVPSRTRKVIMVSPFGDNDVSSVGSTTRLIVVNNPECAERQKLTIGAVVEPASIR